MRHGRTMASVALATLMLAGVHGAGQAVARDMGLAPRFVATTKEGSAAKKANALRQFTGYVTAVDKTSITVEKRGKKPETRVFAKLDEMHSTGDVAKDARVTVYYRDDGGKAVAHRVVVKDGKSGSKKQG